MPKRPAQRQPLLLSLQGRPCVLTLKNSSSINAQCPPHKRAASKRAFAGVGLFRPSIAAANNRRKQFDRDLPSTTRVRGSLEP